MKFENLSSFGEVTGNSRVSRLLTHGAVIIPLKFQDLNKHPDQHQNRIVCCQ